MPHPNIQWHKKTERNREAGIDRETERNIHWQTYRDWQTVTEKLSLSVFLFQSFSLPIERKKKNIEDWNRKRGRNKERDRTCISFYLVLYFFLFFYFNLSIFFFFASNVFIYYLFSSISLFFLFLTLAISLFSSF